MDPLHSSAVGVVAMPGISAQSPWTDYMRRMPFRVGGCIATQVGANRGSDRGATTGRQNGRIGHRCGQAAPDGMPSVLSASTQCLSRRPRRAPSSARRCRRRRWHTVARPTFSMQTSIGTTQPQMQLSHALSAPTHAHTAYNLPAPLPPSRRDSLFYAPWSFTSLSSAALSYSPPSCMSEGYYPLSASCLTGLRKVSSARRNQKPKTRTCRAGTIDIQIDR